MKKVFDRIEEVVSASKLGFSKMTCSSVAEHGSNRTASKICERRTRTG